MLFVIAVSKDGQTITDSKIIVLQWMATINKRKTRHYPAKVLRIHPPILLPVGVWNLSAVLLGQWAGLCVYRWTNIWRAQGGHLSDFETLATCILTGELGMDSQPHLVWFCQIIQGICPSHCPSWMPFPTVISLERCLFTMRKQIFRDFEEEITLILLPIAEPAILIKVFPSSGKKTSLHLVWKLF